jgi:peroxiredoxin
VDLEENWEQFEALNVELMSIMVDPLEWLAEEAEWRGIWTTVASDEDKAVSETYYALEASMHPGEKPGHTFLLVNKRGQIIWRWDWMGHGQPMYLDVDEIYDKVVLWLGRSG